MQGTVAHFNYLDGFGVIRPDEGGRDIHFLSSAVRGTKSLPTDQRVEFDLIYGPKGPQAVDIRRVANMEK